eukprot:ANDGO_01506.mRNA.1 hypothetical protein
MKKRSLREVLDGRKQNCSRPTVGTAADEEVRGWKSATHRYSVNKSSEIEVFACSGSGTESQCVEAPSGHSGSVHAAAFSPDGKRIASGSEDKTMEVCGQPDNLFYKARSQSRIVALAVSDEQRCRMCM